MGQYNKQVRHILFIVIFVVIISTVSFVFADLHAQQVEALEEQLLYSETLNEELEGHLAQAEVCIFDLENINAEILSENEMLIQENNELITTVEDLKGSEYKLAYLGEFKITYYCCETHPHICNSGGSGLTATGTTVTPGRTIAVDPHTIPYGTKVYIAGTGWRTAEDTGGAIKGNVIDVAVSTHDEAMSLGVQYKDIWVLIKN